MYRILEPPALTGYQEYITAISAEFCPFLSPAHARGMVRYSVYHSSANSMEKAQSELFYVGLIHAEILRETRRGATSSSQLLACENVIIIHDDSGFEGEELFSWPHWLLKKEYTGMGVMFGKFWRGETANSRAGNPIPPSPHHMLSIRSAVKPKDPGFFIKAPELLSILAAAVDEGQSSFVGLIDDEMRAILASAGKSYEAVVACIEHLEQTGLYQTLLYRTE